MWAAEDTCAGTCSPDWSAREGEGKKSTVTGRQFAIVNRALRWPRYGEREEAGWRGRESTSRGGSARDKGREGQREMFNQSIISCRVMDKARGSSTTNQTRGNGAFECLSPGFRASVTLVIGASGATICSQGNFTEAAFVVAASRVLRL